MALIADIPSASINNLWTSQVSLTELARGQWSTVTFDFPSVVIDAFERDEPSIQLLLGTNVSSQGIRLDNLRMMGNLRPQTVIHIEGSPPADVALLPFGGFEDLADWTSDNVVPTLETGMVVNGSAALRLSPVGTTTLVREQFSTAQIPDVTDVLSLDVFVSDPQPNPWWVGDIQLFASCPAAGLNNVWIGYRPLTHLFINEFNQLTFGVPEAVLSAWSSGATDCRITIAVNANPGSGAIILDRLGFL